MSSLQKLQSLSVDDYLAGEEVAEVRHEYVAGAVHAMIGTTLRHNAIALALAKRLDTHLQGSGCRAYMSDVKVRVAHAFYYPDVVVTCMPFEPEAVYLTAPLLIVEVLSTSTEGRDRLEKWVAYKTLPSLQEYVLVAQDAPAIDVYRRTAEGWDQISYGASEDLELDSVDLHMPMAEIYAV